ncbi:MAG TPA: hypothetical protein VLV47_00930 [Candidatus Bathyarchaeia archaeon]|nr:hypothetical protein [Candidatus Bathyarchaeia archaeon]
MPWTRKLLLGFGLMAVLAQAAPAWQVPAAGAPTVSDQVIQQVLEPLRLGMHTQNIQLVLSVFDKKELDSYSNLQGQLRAFFQQFSEVNLRYQLLQVTAENGRGSATVEMQMDALPYEPTEIAARRSVQMRLQLMLGPKAWKIAGFTPADFFDVNYRPR